MPNTVAQHAVATFTSPVNGTTPIDANTVRGNDNTTRTSYNNHDADPGIHLQSSTLASRPVAGTAGRKWMTADAGSIRIWHDNGTAWEEASYLSGGGGTISGSLLITGTLGVTGLITATGGVSGNVTGNLTGNASTATALATARNINGVSFNGTADITVTAAAGTLTGSTLASGVTASSLTSVGTLSSLTVSGNTIVGAEVFRNAATSFLRLDGGSGSGSGANIIAFGETHASAPGRISLSAVGAGAIQMSAGGALRATLDSTGNLAVDTNTLFVDAVNNRVGVGDTTPGEKVDVIQDVNASLNMRVRNVNAGSSAYAMIGVNASGNSWGMRMGSSAANNNALQWVVDAFSSPVVKMTLDTSGNLAVDTNTLFVDAANNAVGFGTLTPSSRAHAVVADGSYSIAGSGTTRGFRVEHNTTETRIVGVDNTLTGSFQPLSLGGSTVLVRTNGSTLAATFDTSGNLGLGVTPSAWSGLAAAMQVQNASLVTSSTGAVDTYFSSNGYYNSGWKYIIGAAATQYIQNAAGDHRWLTAPSGTAGNAISFHQGLTLDANSRLNNVAIASQGAQFNLFANAQTSGEITLAQGFSTATDNVGYLFNRSNAAFVFGTNNAERARIPALGGMVVGTAALATTATDGFLYVPTCAGTPTGVPTTQTGTAAIVINTTNNKLYFYSGGAWRDAGP